MVEAAMPHAFFDEQRPHSRVKSEIVAKYFPAWAGIVSSKLRPGGFLVYLDLFSGPGRFGAEGASGPESTPLLVTRAVMGSPRLRQIVRLVFNDRSESCADRLKRELGTIPGLGELAYQPSVFSDEVGDTLAATFAAAKLHPTLSFVDPFGYRGLTRELVRGLIKDWGSECVFFLNDAAIRRALSNPKVTQPMAALFGDARARDLGARIERLPARTRGRTVINELEAALREVGAGFVLPFLLTATTPRRRHFHVVFVTKHPKGYNLMKEVMRRLGHLRQTAEGHWEIALEDPSNPWLFRDAAADELTAQLPKRFTGKTLTVIEVFKSHQAGTPFILRAYP